MPIDHNLAFQVMTPTQHKNALATAAFNTEQASAMKRENRIAELLGDEFAVEKEQQNLKVSQEALKVEELKRAAIEDNTLVTRAAMIAETLAGGNTAQGRSMLQGWSENATNPAQKEMATELLEELNNGKPESVIQFGRTLSQFGRNSGLFDFTSDTHSVGQTEDGNYVVFNKGGGYQVLDIKADPNAKLAQVDGGGVVLVNTKGQDRGLRTTIVAPEETLPGVEAQAQAAGRGTVQGKAEATIETAKPVAEAEASAARAAAAPETIARAQSKMRKLDANLSLVGEAESLVGPLTTGVGALTAGVPGTPARELRAKIATLKADVAFGSLAEMRELSPTGGALGNVSNVELALLESAVAALDQGLSPEAMKRQLELVRQHYQRARFVSQQIIDVNAGRITEADAMKAVNALISSEEQRKAGESEGSSESIDDIITRNQPGG